MNNQQDTDKLQASRRVAASVYLCQVLAFGFFGLPLLVGVALNFLNRNDAEGTWLESHFNWQIQTAWMSLAGFSVAGLTFDMGGAIPAARCGISWTARPPSAWCRPPPARSGCRC